MDATENRKLGGIMAAVFAALFVAKGLRLGAWSPVTSSVSALFLGLAWGYFQRQPQAVRRIDMSEFLIEYWQFIRENKSYWIIPLLVMLALAGGLIVFAKGSAIAPFIYTLF